MQTRSSSRLISDQTSNPTSSTNPNPKGRNRRRSKQRIENSNLKEHSTPIDMMTDQRIMTELLRAPTEGYVEAIVVPLILAEQFELKHSLINMMTTYQFFGLEKDNPYDHIRWGSPPVVRKRTLAPRFFDAAAGGNLLERSTQDVLTIIKNKSKVRNSRSKLVVSQVKACDVNSNSSSEIAKLIHAVNQQTSAVTTAMTAMLKQFQATPPPAPVKSVEETCVTCGGAHPFCSTKCANKQNRFGLAQGFNHGNNFNHEQSYQAPAQRNQNVHLNELEKVRRMNEANMKSMQTQINMVKNELRNKMKNSIQTSLSNQTNEIKNMMASLLQMKTASTSGSRSLPSNTVTNPKCELKAITTHSGLVIDEPTTARALIDVHGEEMILRDGDERLTLNMRHDTSSYSNQPQKESINLINVFDNSKGCNVLSEKLLDLDSTKDLHPPLHDNPLSGSTTYFSNPFLEDLKDAIDQKNLANPADIFVDAIPEMFTDEHALDYSSPLIFDEYDDDFLEVEVDSLPSTNNEDKIFNPGILIQEKPVEIITRVVQDKKLEISNASLVLKDFDPSFYEPLLFKEVPKSKMLLPFSSENEEKKFKPGIHTSEKVHSSFVTELSHQGYKVSKSTRFSKAL
uniref:Reverse transcriptase domain-containing protein n=1 Tax=Tanacetum cinerariifolium TaxID=118510 RepID=A0A6L2L2A7_TANCI|nr:hypothetical protein [Tanacetum cinerariifolium]